MITARHAVWPLKPEQVPRAGAKFAASLPSRISAGEHSNILPTTTCVCDGNLETWVWVCSAGYQMSTLGKATCQEN